jgi:hypothetical protein
MRTCAASYEQSRTWELSTSTLSCEMFESWGFGEVVPHGFGVGYTLNKGELTFVITCRTQVRRSSSHVPRCFDASCPKHGRKCKPMCPYAFHFTRAGGQRRHGAGGRFRKTTRASTGQNARPLQSTVQAASQIMNHKTSSRIVPWCSHHQILKRSIYTPKGRSRGQA